MYENDDDYDEINLQQSKQRLERKQNIKYIMS